jgi:hypothetical protein
LKLKLIRRGRHEDRNLGFCCSWFSSFFELSFLNQKEGIVQGLEEGFGFDKERNRIMGGDQVRKWERRIKSRTRELAV